MPSNSSNDNSKKSAGGFVISNLESAEQLDPMFRSNGHYLARGPFRVHSPRLEHWEWGYRLEQVGSHLVFQDGSALGRTILTDAVSVRASDDGSVIWLFGPQEDELIVLTLTAATLDDYRQAILPGIVVAITSPEDAARIVMAELETKRRAKFGLDFYDVITSRIGMVFADDGDTPVLGLYLFEKSGQVHRRQEGEWRKCSLKDEPWYSNSEEEPLLSPFLRSGIAWYDSLARYGAKSAMYKRLERYIYPKFDIDEPDDWPELFNEWEIID